MREYLFRGKGNGTDECMGWVKGSYVPYTWVDGKRSDEPLIITPEGKMYNVCPESIGQYTGVKDGNGLEIFEGDFVTDQEDFEVGVVIWDNIESTYCINTSDTTYGINSFFDNELEVIGNAFDDPELIK